MEDKLKNKQITNKFYLRNLACEHSSGLPVPSSWFKEEPAPAEPHKMNTLVEEIFSISCPQTCVCWSSSASDDYSLLLFFLIKLTQANCLNSIYISRIQSLCNARSALDQMTV